MLGRNWRLASFEYAILFLNCDNDVLQVAFALGYDALFRDLARDVDRRLRIMCPEPDVLEWSVDDAKAVR
jgi:hypothetical protein